MNLTNRPASEIREAIETMDTPSFCPDCGEFRDVAGMICPECGGDSVISYRDMPYYLECAEENEAQSRADHQFDCIREHGRAS
jgi:predicted amidophosphoribosyltransferase